jgi:hypothetical protein
MTTTNEEKNNPTQANMQALIKRVEQLEAEKEALRLQVWKSRRKPPGVIGYAVLLIGSAALLISVLYSSNILALIGLGLSFWGILFLYAKPVQYMKAGLIDSTAIASLTTIDRVLADLKYEGKGIYLPPKHLKDFKSGTVFLPSKKGTQTPTAEQLSKENVFMKDPEGLCLVPSGLGLTNLYETELGTDFSKVDLAYLERNLPKLLIEGLEIVEDFEMKVKDNQIYVRIQGSSYAEFCNKLREFSNICGTFGCPLCSSIACALTRTTGKPIQVAKTAHSPDGKGLRILFKILEDQEHAPTSSTSHDAQV